MSFFCMSCQLTRGVIRRSCALSTDQLFQVGVLTRITRSFSALATSYENEHVRNTSFKIIGRRLGVDTKYPRLLPSISFTGIKNRRFCTKPKVNDELADNKRKVTSEEEEDEELERLIDSVAKLEEGLTEEERQVLAELEEEERQYKENLKGLSDDDYNVWDGSFDGPDKRLSESVSEGHVRFENRQRVIQDVIEEMWNPQSAVEDFEEEPQYFPRGKTGVFDLGELVDLLREENGSEVVAISIPKELDYADHMVIATVGNNKHLVALSTFIRKRFKMKDRKSTDLLPPYDKSLNHRGWIALDLGNIILHIFLQDVRDYYDLETLWTVGPLFDDLTNAPDPEIVQLLNSIK